MSGKELWEKYGELVKQSLIKHNKPMIKMFQWDQLHEVDKYALEALAVLVNSNKNIDINDLDTFLEPLSYEERDIIYKKLNRMGHRIY